MKEPKTTIMILMTETSTNPAPDASVNEFLLPPPDDIVDQDPEASNMSDVSFVHQNLPCKICIGMTASLLYEFDLIYI